MVVGGGLGALSWLGSGACRHDRDVTRALPFRAPTGMVWVWQLRVFLVAMPERVKGQLSDAAPGELQFAPRSLRLMDTSEHEGRLESEFYFLNDRTEGKVRCA